MKCLVLAAGYATRLYPLTKERSKPAVSFGGKYRIVDIPISNCINSGYKKIYLLTQFNSASLHLHISNSYNFDRFSGGFVEILAAEQTLEHSGWYEGTADAVAASTYFPVRDVAVTYASGADIMAEYNKLMPMLGDYYQVAPNWAEARTAWWNMLQRIGAGGDVATEVKAFCDEANK